MSSRNKRIAVVGCGAFGAMIALRLSESGCDVTVFERDRECLRGASFNNQNRLHLGFHYPRDTLTAKQCIQGFTRFCEEFPECVVSGFPNLYFIANDGSHTDENAYSHFCGKLGLDHEMVTQEQLPVKVQNVSKGISCGEVVYDCNILRSCIIERLQSSGVLLKTGMQVDHVRRDSTGFSLGCSGETFDAFDHVINCTYADINRITELLGYRIETVQYEYTIIPIVKLNVERVGITVMDGPFMTLLPHGNSDHFLMYHVDHSVIAREDALKIDKTWLVNESSPFSKIDLQQRFEKMRQSCAFYVPSLADCEMVGVLKGPRMVIAKSDRTDARPSLFKTYDRNYHTVFAGKIDHCVWIADDICEAITAH
ncbi:FAD-binding oxidoreductase [Paracoccaceae bacterium]|nr:FAD-binding oxidoreductase [Paracoccaceae bacterium]